MIKVESLKLRIFTQFVLIIAPITLVLVYQAVSDLERTAAIERSVELRNLAAAAKEGFETFVTLASDAVETGSLGQRALGAFGQSVTALSTLRRKDEAAARGAEAVDAFKGQIVAGMPLNQLLLLQPQIRKARGAIQGMDDDYEQASNATISASIKSARLQTTIVAVATMFTLLLAGWFVYGMIKGVTEPLNTAVDLAGRIAAGEFAAGAARPPQRDLGNLLASLYGMSDRLSESQQAIEEYQRGLEQRVQERTAEVEARTRELTRSVAELQALGDVVRAVNSSLDLETVLSTIVTRAVQLGEADAGTIYGFNEEESVFYPRANYGMSDALVEEFRDSRISLGDGPVGQCATNRAPYQVPDLEKFDYARRKIQLQWGIRALLAVPLLREGGVAGALVIRRKTVGEFSHSVVNLVQTFASQSVLAIENARLFQESQEKSAQLAAASQLKSQFLANMSHELRTPLNAIIGVTEMLHEDARDFKREDEIEPLERVLRAARHLLALINDILDLSKIEAGKMDIHVESFAIAPLINDVVGTLGTLAAKNGNQLTVNCPADIGSMHADQTRIRQALLNLASNANKFTERGAVAIDVRRATENGRDWIEMAVADTGIGLSSEQMGRLFQEFMQADASTTRKYGGTGLGLAISRRFCQMMGGDIRVQSELGRGSTFTIRLPARVGAAQSLPAARVARAAQSAAAPVKGSTILVIDDDQTVREVMARFLEREGFVVKLAAGGHEGLELARALHPAAITLDVNMPDLDGWTVLAAIKGDPQLSDIPVVLVTIEDNRGRGYSLGAAEYMVKPIDRGHLAGVLSRICGAASRHVLLVDDDEIMRQGVRRVLEQEHWEVTEAENGRIALDRLRERCPDVVVLDLMMPVMDGFEFLAAMRQRGEWRNVPVLVLTAKELTTEEHGRLNGDVERVMQKSSSELAELLRELGRVLPQSIELGQRTSTGSGAA